MCPGTGGGVSGVIGGEGLDVAVAGAEAAVGEQKAARYPSLKLNGSAMRYEEPSIVYPIHAFGLDSFPPLNRTVYQSGLAATYTLFDGGGRAATIHGFKSWFDR